eukprot:CAMPEP_0174236202 /NCGR_PEP_ID=MMETSP0417-20130205/5399_1 /TAXON_ID=242541 /ORGANISM="Mayorella sp, Strain BSH-02190019" /LENGTH=355 /DNA_ID=CAMNT_0015314811 /DNA_START=214 /DNA_END=1281 /DNA_ORIENTATION=+
MASDPASSADVHRALDKLRSTLMIPSCAGSQAESSLQSRKVTVVGIGAVGMACATSVLNRGLCSELSLVDIDQDRLTGEMMDLQHGAAFYPLRVNIQASSDYAVTANSNLCIITAGARQREGESRLDLVGRNIQILKSIVPRLIEHSPDTSLLVVSNPVDVLTWAAWKISGLPMNRVFGSGTNLDSSRFRFLLAEKLGVHAQSVHGYIIGEHGDTSVPVWSSLQVGGRHLLPLMKTLGDKKEYASIHTEVVKAAYEVIHLKGYTNWAIGASVGALTASVLQNQCRVHPVTTMVKGMFGIEEEVFLSVPCVLGRVGVSDLIPLDLSAKEREKLLASVKTLAATQASLAEHFQGAKL